MRNGLTVLERGANLAGLHRNSGVRRGRWGSIMPAYWRCGDRRRIAGLPSSASQCCRLSTCCRSPTRSAPPAAGGDAGSAAGIDAARRPGALVPGAEAGTPPAAASPAGRASRAGPARAACGGRRRVDACPPRASARRDQRDSVRAAVRATGEARTCSSGSASRHRHDRSDADVRARCRARAGCGAGRSGNP